ncbi:glutathione peroxidase 1-like isoform X2 [Littorina saxatilis]|uniref:Glutathione peroxidase n=2 Tax=Littorina saxatilis TaxID=31220 RepID=A0AAN9BZI1_9CAEN
MSISHGDKPVPASSVTSFHQLSALLINGHVEALSRYEGRVCLVVNMATGDQATKQELTQLNELATALGPRGLCVLMFPCNQFGGLEPFNGDEIPLILHHVRPGSKFEPRFQLYAKCDVNGSRSSPVFEFLRFRLPQPIDDNMVMSRDLSPITWRPVTRSDVGWNYEKFLVSCEGQPVKRYSNRATMEVIRKDVEGQLKKIPKAVRDHLGLTSPEKQRLTFRDHIR